MSQHTELITVLLKIPVDGDDWKTIKEAADALQAMERVPMTDEQWQEIADITGSIITRRGKDAIEKVLGITPPDSKG